MGCLTNAQSASIWCLKNNTEVVLREGVGLGDGDGKGLGSSDRNGQQGREVGGSKLAESQGASNQIQGTKEK